MVEEVQLNAAIQATHAGDKKRFAAFLSKRQEGNSDKPKVSTADDIDMEEQHQNDKDEDAKDTLFDWERVGVVDPWLEEVSKESQ